MAREREPQRDPWIVLKPTASYIHSSVIIFVEIFYSIFLGGYAYKTMG
ncbi:MAG: hypothetical protein ACI9A2_004277 [Halioglobus sp.]